MLTVLVINSKGGAGKTTLSTNIAGYYASLKAKTAILDYDPQGSISHWLKIRPESAGRIHGASGTAAKGVPVLRSRQNWIRPDTDILVIDAPAGASGALLQELVRRSTHIIIPVTPSPIDIHATADFIKDLYCVGGARRSQAKIAVVASRVRNPSSEIYAGLERFLRALKLPFLARVSDSDNYLHAVGQGLGVYELPEAAAERSELAPIFEWLNLELRPAPEAEVAAVPAYAATPATPPTPPTTDEPPRKRAGVSIFPRFASYLRPVRQPSIPESLRAKRELR